MAMEYPSIKELPLSVAVTVTKGDLFVCCTEQFSQGKKKGGVGNTKEILMKLLCS